jgi:exodeoxyribonuclease V alpha subunit
MKPRARAPLSLLSPLGTARQRLEPSPLPLPPALAEALVDAELGEEHAFLAWQLAAWAEPLSPPERAAFQALVARSLLAVAHGSTRLQVDEPARALLRLIPELVGAPGERRPFILEGEHLYHQRLLACEDRIAAAVRARAGAASRFTDVDPIVAAVVASSAPRPSDEQAAAVTAALSRQLTVITGGPGTGKTTIVVALVRALCRLGVAPERIALAAPTGKAGHRLEESLAAGLAGVAAPEAADRALLAARPSAQTLHRLLGYSPSTHGYQHHEHSHLPHEIVIVDEGSMIDLRLMDRLLRALGPQAVLVLLGDAGQLPSVDAGAVFRDLEPLAVRLARSYRADPAQAAGRRILEVAAQVRAGDAAFAALLDARATAADVSFTGVELVPAAAREALLERWYVERVAALPGFGELVAQTWHWRTGGGEDAGFAPEDAARLDALAAHHQRFRLLCATRGRPSGVDATNASLHRRHGAGRAPFAAGEPIMMLRNDYERGLWNGDQGLVLRVREDGRGPRLVAAFKTQGRWRIWDLASVRDTLALAYALTVHKAQGSELEEVALLLPDEPLPILSRELLYTAITRSRRAVVVCGAPAVLAAGVALTHVRSSGITEKLGRGR